MRYRYSICDVFTETRFAGNPLAVLPEAEGLSGDLMQRIAREFNYSETTFVLPAESGHTRKVRIFTPFDELPFAGHPNIGTAFVLAHTGALGALEASTTVTFEEGAGLVPLDIEVADGRPVACELEAPEALSIGAEAPVEAVAAALSLSPGDFVTDTHAPCTASVGLPFLFAEVRDPEALGRVRVDTSELGALKAAGVPRDIHVYARPGGGRDVCARVMIGEGGYEDPATGSANCALVAMLSQLDPEPDGELALRIEQGVEMGRPSTLHARATKQSGALVSARVGGACAMVASGFLELDD